MNLKFISENNKNILIASFGAFLCMFLIAYLNLIDKTNKFADLQAKFASLRSEDKHVHTQLSDLESENLSLVEESRLLNKPISEIQANLDKLLSERLIVENKLLESRKSIEECNESIHKIERDKIEKEQMAISLREALEKFRLESQASKIEGDNIILGEGSPAKLNQLSFPSV